MNAGQISVIEWSPDKRSKVLEAFMQRPSFEEAAERAAAKILGEIRREGDAAVARYVKKFDKSAIAPARFAVTAADRKRAAAKVDDAFKEAAREADRRIARFAEAGLRAPWSIKTPRGGLLGEQFAPLDRIGAYIPSGAAPLVSTALMTCTLARVAGVPEIVACSPAGDDGEIDPYTLYALDLAGATEIYRVGGIQAVGAMAYGTRRIRKVQKIVGPGGPYVTAAKRQVYGEVNLDLVAGPSEVAVLADTSARPSWVAVDLLSQAEHGTGSEKILLVTTSRKLAEAVRKELVSRLADHPRRSAVETVLRDGCLIAVVPGLSAGMALCNRFAPEHFELLVRKPETWIPRTTCAGAIFVGPWTPEVAGDFAAGPSHVLPTGGAARMFAGLTVDDFQRRSSVIHLAREDLKDVLPVIRAFSRVEQLPYHGESAELRFADAPGKGSA